MDASIAEKPTIYLWKMLILNLNFHGERHSFVNCLLYILIILRKCLAFQFLTSGISMSCPICPVRNRGWKWTFHQPKNRRYSSEKCLFWFLTSKVKVSSVVTSCFIFWLFKVNVSLFSTGVMAYVFIFLSLHSLKIDPSIAEKSMMFCSKIFLFED